MPSPLQVEGRCLCGACVVALDAAPEYSLVCHCRDCQRSTGSAFKPFSGVKRSALTVVEGQALRRYGEDQAHNAFCGTCGSPLYAVVRDGEYVHIPLGVLDEPPALLPSAHLFVRSNPSWNVIGDDLPRFAAFPEPPGDPA